MKNVSLTSINRMNDSDLEKIIGGAHQQNKKEKKRCGCICAGPLERSLVVTIEDNDSYDCADCGLANADRAKNESF